MVTKFFHKAPRVLENRIPAQQVGINVEGFDRIVALPKALNMFYTVFGGEVEAATEAVAAMQEIVNEMQAIVSEFEWYEAD